MLNMQPFPSELSAVSLFYRPRRKMAEQCIVHSVGEGHPPAICFPPFC